MHSKNEITEELPFILKKKENMSTGVTLKQPLIDPQSDAPLKFMQKQNAINGKNDTMKLATLLIFCIALIIYVFWYYPKVIAAKNVIIAQVPNPGNYVVIDAASQCSAQQANPNFPSNDVSNTIEPSKRIALLKSLFKQNIAYISPFHNIALHYGSNGEGFDKKEDAAKACAGLDSNIKAKLASISQIHEAISFADTQWWDFGWVSDSEGMVAAPLHPNAGTQLFNTNTNVYSNEIAQHVPMTGEKWPACCYLDLPLPYTKYA